MPFYLYEEAAADMHPVFLFSKACIKIKKSISVRMLVSISNCFALPNRVD